MKIAVTGPRGRLGSELVKRGAIPIYADVTKPSDIKSELAKIDPIIIIHTAAYTDVDGAEEHTEQAFQVNVHGTANVRDAFSGPIIHISTDYVFDGQHGPYHEKARPTILNWYGLSKTVSESMIWQTDLIVRTTLLYACDSRPDFVKWVLSKFDAGHAFTAEDNVRGNPTYVPHLAEALMQLASRKANQEPLPHIINVAGRDTITRYDFANRIGSVFHRDISLCYPSLEKNPERVASRPVHGGLKTDLAERCHVPIYSVQEGLEALKKQRES